MGGTTIGGTTAARWQAAGWAGLAGRSTKYGWIYIKQAQNDNLTIYYRISGGNTRC
jgi:hypothetical protein